MRAILRLVSTAALSVTLLPGIAGGQVATTETVLRRVDSLQARIAELDRRVGELENRLKAAPPRTAVAPSTPDPRDIANWRRLRVRMSMDEVRAVLGEPEKVDGGSVAFWYYPALGSVTFISGRVTSWSEPSR